MSYEIQRTDTFSRHLKQLSEKHLSIKDDYAALLQLLQENPKQGSPLGKDCSKIRMKIASKKTGKSGGTRVITLVKMERHRITLLDIFDKSEKETLTDKKLDDLLKQVPE